VDTSDIGMNLDLS